MEQTDLKEILEQHRKWLAGKGGERAYLRGAYLRGADLRDAELRGADLSLAALSGADLSRADLPEIYADIPVTLAEVRDVILSHRDRLQMDSWHTSDDWRNGTAKAIDECGTAHCIAGWAHHLASLKDPRYLDESVNVYLLGRMALGEEAASHFYDSNEDALAWLESI